MACPPHSDAPEWTDLIHQFFALSGAHSTPPHVPAIGLEEQGYHLVRQGVPILASADHVEIHPEACSGTLVDPIPLYAWSMAWRRDAETEGIAALREAAAELAAADDWLPETAGGRATWLPRARCVTTGQCGLQAGDGMTDEDLPASEAARARRRDRDMEAERRALMRPRDGQGLPPGHGCCRQAANAQATEGETHETGFDVTCGR